MAAPPKNGWQEADALASLNFDELQSVGLSRRKAEYVIELARAETDGRLNLKQLNKQPAEKFSAKLIGFRGIGGWTVSNYRLFCLSDFDAWPGNDLALMKAVKRLKMLDRLPTHSEMDNLHASGSLTAEQPPCCCGICTAASLEMARQRKEN